MIVNRLVEGARALRLDRRLLARRAREAAPRPPLIVVPPCMGTKLVDDRGRRIWGGPLDVLLGIPRLDAPSARTGGALLGYPLLPGIWSYDVLGGLLRFLERVGGATRDEELFVLGYDWRLGMRHGAEELARLVDRIRGVGDTPVDLVAISSGGAVARAYLAGAGRGDPRPVRRVVHLGVPQRGTFSAFEYLQRGVQLVDRARFVPPERLATSQTVFDSLPHPDDPIFVDEQGAPVARDLYDPATWRELRLAGADRPDLPTRLAEARAMHALLDAAPPHADSFAIAARHLRTAARARIARGSVTLPDCCAAARGAPGQAELHTPGDGSVPEASLRAGIDPERIWWVRPAQHRLIVSDPAAHALVLEALLAPARPVPRDLYDLRRDHRPPSRTTVAPFM